MAKKTQKSVEIAEVKNVENNAVKTQKLIAVKFKFGRWYVYFKGVRPEENVGKGCNTAKSALRYMFYLKSKFEARIQRESIDKLKLAAEYGA